MVEVDRNIFEFHLPQWAGDPVKGYEPLLRQQGLRRIRPPTGTYHRLTQQMVYFYLQKIRVWCPYLGKFFNAVLTPPFPHSHYYVNLHHALGILVPAVARSHLGFWDFHWGGAEGPSPLLTHNLQASREEGSP